VADPSITDYTEILKNTISSDNLAKTKVFHLRGGIDYGNLGFVHKTLMAVMKKTIEKKPLSERESDDIGLLEIYGKDIDFSDKSTISPLVEYVKTL